MENCDFEESSETKKLSNMDGLYDLKNLPTEFWLKIFHFFDLQTWKTCRMVSQQWNEILCQSAFTSQFVLKIKNCEISPEMAPMSTFMNTFSFFAIVIIERYVSLSSILHFSKFLKSIGKGTRYLLLHPRTYGEFVFLDLREKLPVLRTLECPAMTLFASNFPKTIKTFILSEMPSTSMVLKIRINELLQDPSTKVIVNSIDIKDFDEPLMEFIQVDKTLVKIMQAFGSTKFEISPINLRETQSVGMVDVIEIKNAKCWHTKGVNDDIILKNLGNLQNLQSIDVVIETRCFFGHKPIKNAGIKRFVISEVLDGVDCCEMCLIAAIRSFPNLKTFLSWDVNVDLDWLLVKDFELEFIQVSHGDVRLAPLLQTPPEMINKLSNLTVLELNRIVDEDINWIDLFKKWPKMSKLTVLLLEINHFIFAPFLGFFMLCPNVKEFSLIIPNFPTNAEMVELFMVMPNLESFALWSDLLPDGYAYQSKNFVDAIAPFAKKLRAIELPWDQNLEESENEILTLEEFESYMKEKIHTLDGVM